MTTELQPSAAAGPGYRSAQHKQLDNKCPVPAPPPPAISTGGTPAGPGGGTKHYHQHHRQPYHNGLDYPPPPAATCLKPRRSSPDAIPEDPLAAPKVTPDAYGDEDHQPAYLPKKNAPGYKNDSGYSESLGFESFSLALSERDAASPPPTPPVRDASSLKSVCYGPGHEKYPSWPEPHARTRYDHTEDDEDDGPHPPGSHRSKSWTDHTNYPKEKPASYTRPHNKRPNATSYTQQLKTVMERCEKIPADAFDSRASRGTTEADLQSKRMWPAVDREGKILGDAEYNVPSPPERESKTLSPSDLEAYVRSYQEQPTTQVELYGDNDLTEGLEEYTTVQHSQQASYAQSEGYHSYVSSVDSTTTTPFLDRLRRDSEAVSQRPMSSWEDGSSREGRDSVVTTSSGSASSSETLKWHGSMSDVSVSSGMPTSRSSGIGTQDRWHHGSMSDISSINGMAPTGKSVEEHDKWAVQDPPMIGDHLIDHRDHKLASNRLARDSWQVSMNDRNKEEHNNHSMSKSFHAGMDRSGVINDQSAADWENSIHSSMSDVSQSNGIGAGSKQLIAHSARVQTPQRHHSESVLYLDRERSQQRKLYPVSTSKLDDTQISRHQPTSPQQAQPSVAERISELERQQNQQLALRYTYLDPEKRHRVPDPTLKAIQKKALLSFYERHQNQNSSASWRSEPQLQPQNQSQEATQKQQQRNSPPPQPPPRPKPLSSRRASSASDYATGNWREKNTANDKTSQPQQQQQPPVSNGTTGGESVNNSGANSNNSGASEMPQPRHQHSNSCGSLSTDLIGPVIVGPAISIDDWVPERPPKKPYLRTAYSERLPSPDLPPPSPPTVTEVEVINSDIPLPPPPPELSVNCTTVEPKITPPERLENSFISEAPCERIKERNSSSRRSSRKKASVETSPNNSPPKSNSLSPNHEHQQHSFHFDYKSNSKIDPHSPTENGFPISRASARGRSSLRYPTSTRKHGALDDRLAPYSLASQMSDLMASKYSDSGNQRAAPQVPVTNSCREVDQKVKRHESFTQESHFMQKGARTQMPKNTSPTSSGNNKYGQQQQRGYFAGLPPKFSDSQAPPAYDAVVTSAPRHSPPPPPLAPRTSASKKLSPPPRPAPPAHGVHQGSQSKASYLAYRRERGAPDSEGSYKRTMSPNARLDDPVLLKVTPHHQINNMNNNNNNNNNSNSNKNHNNNNNNSSNQRHELSKSQSSDALQSQQQRLDDHFSRKSVHNVSYGTGTEEKRERLSPQSVEVLNDRNRQLERERRKLVAEASFFRESCTTTIEMTSQNVEMLNRRNEKQRLARSPNSTSPKFQEAPSSPSTTELTSSAERKVSSPAQTDQTGSSWDRKTPSSSISSSSSVSSSITSSPLRSSPSGSISPVDSGSRSSGEVGSSRVNTSTNDVASQTECSAIGDDSSRTRSEEEQPESLKPRKKLQEEIEYEQLSRDLAEQLGPNDKLLPILVPAAEHKKSTDYVVDLFRIEAAFQPRPRPRLSIDNPASSDSLDNDQTEEDNKKIDSLPTSPVSPSIKPVTSGSPLSPRSSCFTTSESKTRFLGRHLQYDESNDEQNSSETAITRSSPDNVDLRQKKEELMVRLDKKLVVLRAEQEAVREEGEVNEALGARVGSRISELARPAEASKYRLHVEEVGKITSLLLGLSGRLARAENALYDMPADHAERKLLEAKRDKLIDQLEEAKILKSNIDRRSVNVSAIIAKYLSDEEYADYQHFINMKAKLIVDGREIQDKVKLGEEQLVALKEAIDL